MTPASKDFITPLTLSTLSKNPVHSLLLMKMIHAVWNNHVELGFGQTFYHSSSNSKYHV